MGEDDATGDGSDGRELEGLTVEEAAAAVADDGRGAMEVRAALSTVAEDGVVSEAAAEDAIGEAAMTVSTPETRVELAGAALEDARAAAEGAEDVDAVAARLTEYEQRFADLEAELDALTADLDALTDRGTDRPLYEVGQAVREVENEADRLQRAADELAAEAESFERWVDDPAVRADELAGDLDALTEAVDALAAGLDGLERGDAAGDLSSGWAEGRLRAAALALFVTDARAELDDLRTLAEREGDDDERLDDLDDRVGDLGDRVAEVNERVDDLATPDWQDEHAESIVTFDAFLGEREPPVDWGEVQAELEEHFAEIAGEH